jgi:hypothetical protein
VWDPWLIGSLVWFPPALGVEFQISMGVLIGLLLIGASRNNEKRREGLQETVKWKSEATISIYESCFTSVL